MARPRQQSKVQIPPRVKGFMPLGYYAEEDEPVQLNIEEFEAIRLLDYENLSQAEAAVLMHISRPTLTRIYERARKKIALALTEAHQILIEGGKALFEGEWYACTHCDSKFNNPHHRPVKQCILCGNSAIQHIKDSI